LKGIHASLLQVFPGETILGINAAGGSIHFAQVRKVGNDPVAIGIVAMNALAYQM
jgi:hypothetical protein